MAIINCQTGFYTSRIGSTDSGVPVYLYFDPTLNEFRAVIVPQTGIPYFAPAGINIRHDSDHISPLASTVVGGAIGVILGGAPGAAIGAAIGAFISQLSQNPSKSSMA